MDTEGFWRLIEDSRVSASGRSSRERILQDRLTTLAPGDIVAFQVFLDQTRSHAFTWDLWGAAMRIFGGWCSDDGFAYFRMWLIGQGRATFEDAVASPDSLAEVDAVRRLAGRPPSEWDDDCEWPEWESLDYVAKNAYESATGSAGECGEIFYDAVRSQLSKTTFERHPLGEHWDARDEAIAALKIPLLAARFPLN
jgi:hypothetical protein